MPSQKNFYIMGVRLKAHSPPSAFQSWTARARWIETNKQTNETEKPQGAMIAAQAAKVARKRRLRPRGLGAWIETKNKEKARLPTLILLLEPRREALFLD
jgi:hypothetical protein